MAEDVFDLRKWSSIFPLSNSWKVEVGEGGAAVTPFSVTFVEQVRLQLEKHGDMGPSVPADIFVGALGESSQRDITKVGGAPYRPAGKPWPADTEGRPMTFIAQYRFTESRDILPELPGEVLLIFFSDPENVWPDDPPDTYRFEWYPLGIEALVDPSHVPRSEFEFINVHGIRHRTVDYLDDVAVSNCMRRAGCRSKYDLPDDYFAMGISKVHGIKIGGVPAWYRPEWERNKPMPGTFICSLSDVQTSGTIRYPWVNCSEPDPSMDKRNQVLVWGDGGEIYFFLHDDGSVRWKIHRS